MSNTFRVTTDHIDEWYKENRWWVDELNEYQLLRLCGIFYIYQKLEQDRDPSLVIQDTGERERLTEYLKLQTKIKTETLQYLDSSIRRLL